MARYVASRAMSSTDGSRGGACDKSHAGRIGAAHGFQFALRMNRSSGTRPERAAPAIFSVCPKRTVLVSIVETSTSILGRSRMRAKPSIFPRKRDFIPGASRPGTHTPSERAALSRAVPNRPDVTTMLSQMYIVLARLHWTMAASTNPYAKYLRRQRAVLRSAIDSGSNPGTNAGPDARADSPPIPNRANGRSTRSSRTWRTANSSSKPARG